MLRCDEMASCHTVNVILVVRIHSPEPINSEIVAVESTQELKTEWPSGKATDCKSVIKSSNLFYVSNF